MVTWETSRSLEGGEVHHALYKGYQVEIWKVGYGYSGSFFNAKRHVNCGESQNLETFKERILATVDIEAARITGKWHPYPDEKPSGEVKEYIVSVVLPDGEPFSLCSEWQGDEESRWGGCNGIKVVAWTELPDPYMGGEE